jgi:outer membrane lipoprotein-sorting protein
MMCVARSRAVLIVLITAPLLLTSCLGTKREITRGKQPGTTVLLNADKQQLVKIVSDFYEAIQSFSVTGRLVASKGSVYKGEIKDFPEAQAYIDFRKPSDIRIVGLLPFVGTTAFQMVSDGKTFKASVPPNSRYFEGDNDAEPASENKFENIRPQMFLSAMLVKPVDPAHEMTIKVDDITERYAYYQLEVVRKMPDGDIRAERRITFDRVNLYIIEEREYAPDGSIVILSQYGDWQTYNGVRFPSHIDISRPKEEIALELNITKMEMNVPIPDAKFVLTKPDGYELKIIGKPQAAGQTDPPKGSK